MPEINPFPRQNPISGKDAWAQGEANKGYNATWKSLQEKAWESATWDSGVTDPASKLHQALMSTVSFAYGMLEEADSNNDGKLEYDNEFALLLGDTYATDRARALFNEIDKEVKNTAGDTTILSKDGKIEHGELGAFLLFVKQIVGNKDAQITKEEMDSAVTKLLANESVTFHSLVTNKQETMSAKDALQSYINDLYRTKKYNLNDVICNNEFGINPSSNNTIDWTKFGPNRNLFTGHESEDADEHFDNGGTIDLDSFLDSSDDWEIGFGTYNPAAFAAGILQEWGAGADGTIAKETINKLKKDDAITSSQERLLLTLMAGGKVLGTNHMTAFLMIIDAATNGDGRVTEAEQTVFFNKLSTSKGKSDQYKNANPPSAKDIKNYGDLEDAISKLLNEQDALSDVKFNKDDYERAMREVSMGDEENLDYSLRKESNFMEYFEKGSLVKNLFNSSFKMTDPSGSHFNLASFVKGVVDANDQDFDGILNASELGAKSGKYKDFFERITGGNSEAGLTEEEIGAILQMVAVFNDVKDGNITKTHFNNFITKVNRLDESEDTSEIDIYEVGAVKKLETLGDFRALMDAALDYDSERDAVMDLYEIDPEAFAQATDYQKGVEDFMASAIEDLRPYDENGDGKVSKVEYQEIVEANVNAQGLTGREAAKAKQAEMEKFTRMAGIGAGGTDLEAGELAALKFAADTMFENGDNDGTADESELESLNKILFDSRADGYDRKNRELVQNLASQIGKSKALKTLQEEMDAEYKELEKKRKAQQKPTPTTPTPAPNQQDMTAAYYQWLMQMMGGGMSGGYNPYSSMGGGYNQYGYGMSGGYNPYSSMGGGGYGYGMGSMDSGYGMGMGGMGMGF